MRSELPESGALELELELEFAWRDYLRDALFGEAFQQNDALTSFPFWPVGVL
jgi:hypothetical protein